ncbi:hypothetical protein CO650_11020 [Rhizobium phaseoli]|nr:hypothetical protein CO650_11020 [Rhizobium phaseoli]
MMRFDVFVPDLAVYLPEIETAALADIAEGFLHFPASRRISLDASMLTISPALINAVAFKCVVIIGRRKVG